MRLTNQEKVCLEMGPKYTSICLNPQHLQLAIRKELNEYKETEMEVHEESRHLTRLHEYVHRLFSYAFSSHPLTLFLNCLTRDGPSYPQFVSKVGARVRVEGYAGLGTLRFFGPHKTRPGSRCGVEFDQPVGKNNGTIDGHTYFVCQPNHGILVRGGREGSSCCQPADTFSHLAGHAGSRDHGC